MMQRKRNNQPEVKIFGERNTGTNALRALIQGNSATRVCPSTAKELTLNFRLVSRALRIAVPKSQRRRIMNRYIDHVFANAPPRTAWKHTATNFDDITSLDGCPVIFTTRHPASWLLGLHRHPYHAFRHVDHDFAAFLDTPWRLVGRDNLGRRALTPCELFNLKARSHLSLMERLSRKNMPWQVVRFEQFVISQRSAFSSLRGILAAPAQYPAIVERSTKEKGKDYKFYQEYYGEERWRDEITDSCAEIIRRSIDWDIVRDYGYSPL
jgi:hypothetical protein